MATAPYLFWSQYDHVPSKWYLFESLLWVSDQRIPYGDVCADWYLSDPEEEGFSTIPPDLSRSPLMHLEHIITAEAGIGPCPMSFHHFEHHVENIENQIASIEGLLNRSKGNVAKAYEKQIQELEDLLHDRSEWIIDLESYLDEAKTKLFMLLRTGELTAYGTKLPTRSMTSAKQHVKDYSASYRAAKNEKIPPDAWSLSNALWTDCALQTVANTYVFVHLNRDDLLQYFRPIFKGPVNGGYIDGYMITGEVSEPDNTVETSNVVPVTKTGRPSYNWEAFHIEVTRQIIDGTIPTKQMAGVSDFQTWFMRTQSQKVGQSTIAEKLKPYYDEFIRPKSRK